MNLFPLRNETVVLPYKAEEVEHKLWKTTWPVTKNADVPDVGRETFLFNGWVLNGRFRISRRVNNPENFLPIISGAIEGTSVGSIIFLKYRMFFSSNVFIIFWTAVTLLVALFFIFYYEVYLYAALSFLFGIGNYAIAIANFNIQVKKSRKLLDKALR